MCDTHRSLLVRLLYFQHTCASDDASALFSTDLLDIFKRNRVAFEQYSVNVRQRNKCSV